MNILIDAIDYLSKRGRHSEHVKQLSDKFVNLAPTDKADEDWIYFSALNKAIKDPDVYNIALTGPYGSGKSSVIRSFLKRRKKPALEISLASFLPETDGISTKVSKQEIERSILQQMLYGSDANRLPLSRFKRIRAPGRWNWAVSLIILLGCIALWHLFQSRGEILSGDFFRPVDLTNWLNLTVAAFGFVFFWKALHRVYLKSFGISFKSVSLTDVEITLETAQEESILNRHLDEIIYFFQSTNYELVIIEDLDRFDNPDIFVTLREINSLINANFSVKKKVRFLYALRDDIFTNTDRTKFFEFIVPVIPIINHSNSIDKVLEEGQRLSIDSKLNQQFLREVSRYLIDLRLIKNIFNEFVTYEANLGSADDDSLDPNKLLAVLIYKNVQPNDFENLHQQQGALADILSRHEEFVSSAEADVRAQILEIKNRIAKADKQLPRTLGELRKIYAMAIVEHMPQNSISVNSNNNTIIPLKELADHTEFENVLAAPNNRARTVSQGNVGFNISTLETNVDPNMTYLQRKAEVELSSAEERKQSSIEIRKLRSKMATIRTAKFSNVIRTNASQIEDCFSKLGDSEDLIKFLIFEGFLDDTYYQYISLFHSGRLSPNDNKFLIHVRSFNNPDPDFRLDNQAEVIAMMREDDFDQRYVLNSYLMDEMMGHVADYDAQINKAVRYIADNFAECSDFFASYYSNGKQVAAFVNALAERWDGFASTVAETSAAAEHMANIVDFVPAKKLVETLNINGAVSSFLGTNLSTVLEVKEGVDLEKVKLLEVEVEDVSTLLSYRRAFQFVIQNSLYRITTDNIRTIMEHSLNADVVAGLSDKHYTTILGSGNEEVCRHIERNFITYLRRVLLQTEGNTREEIETIQRVLGHDEVSQELLNEFLAKQHIVFPSLELIPLEFHTQIFEERMIEPTWENLISYRHIDKFDADVLTRFMQSPDEKRSLLLDTYADNDWTSLLSSFILINEDFSDDEYRQYVQKLPTIFSNFPDTAPIPRRLILIEEGVIGLTEEVFKTAQVDEIVVESLLVHNIEKYLEDQSKYPIDDLFREKLIASEISDNQKLSIIEDVDPATVLLNASLAEKMGSIFNRMDIDLKPHGPDFVLAVLRNVKPLTAKISLLNKCHEVLTFDQVHQIIKKMPDPFPDAFVPWKHPRIQNTPDNNSLVRWLEERKIISSSSVTIFDEIKINTFRKPRSQESEPK